MVWRGDGKNFEIEPHGSLMGQCTAKSKRSGKRCQKWAIRGKSVCRMHGAASRGPITPEGKRRARQAALRNGRYLKKAKDSHRKIMALIRECKNTIKQFS